ncbi:glycosyltransferase family 4 protein [Aliinostoc sp. HNIBRCY26]|uniref:glycosyltransferase family 4 protein n=1 Tax=Aliinostoc sp. HNIBRCY26 TaxID=3418997 RepID=UPI003D06E91C
MNIKKILVTGDKFMISRMKFLFQAMSDDCDRIEYLSVNSIYSWRLLKDIANFIQIKLPFLNLKRTGYFRKNAKTFINSSRQLEQKIINSDYHPDLIFHLYGMFSPCWDKFDIPYVMYLDYTMVLARKNWIKWAPFPTEQEFQAWLDCEHQTYTKALHIFTKSHKVKYSLEQDYGINSDKITVLHSSGNFFELYQGEKKFGSKQILFNGYDFFRKGGDLLIDAFKQVKQVIPEAKLVIVGEVLSINEDGVDNPGYISSPTEMQRIFLNTDLVVSPARCEPLGLFLVEAMNYGIPCIVSDQDGMPEIIEHEINGLVISQPTPEVLAKQMIDLLSDSQTLKFMSENARRKVKEELNWPAIAQKIKQTLINI